MIAVVFTNQADADAFSAAVHAKTGPYPKEGIDVGGGIHMPKAQCAAVRYANVRKHPTNAEWAYVHDATVEAQAIALPPDATVKALDASWDSAPVVIEAQ